MFCQEEVVATLACGKLNVGVKREGDLLPLDILKWVLIKIGHCRPLFVYFRHFYMMTQIKYKLIEALMVCLGLKIGMPGLKA